MRIIKTNKYDATNGPGIRYSIWIAGCGFHCKGCWNSVTWNFNQGKKYKECKERILNEIKNSQHIKGVSILGGEPLWRYIHNNDNDILDLLNELNKLNINTWLWTGFEYNEVPQEILEKLNAIITGPFIEEKKNLNLQYMGSSNQKLTILK